MKGAHLYEGVGKRKNEIPVCGADHKGVGGGEGVSLTIKKVFFCII